MQLIFLLSVFIATLLAMVGLLTLLGRRSQVPDRLATLTAGANGATFTEAPAPRQLWLPPFLQDWRPSLRIREELWMAGLALRPADFVLLTALSVLLLGGFALYITRNPLTTLCVGSLGLLGPIAGLRRRQAQRRILFEQQLPDALSLVSSSLRSGYSFLQSLQLVSEEQPAPMSEEARRILQEVQVGFTQEEALDRLVGRMRSYDVELLVTAIGIQTQVGGNLAELIDNIAQTIRERFRTRSEVSALSAEGRISAWVLCCLPVVMLILLTLNNTDYTRLLFEHPLGRIMLGAAICAEIAGVLVIRRLIQVDA